MPIKMYDSLQVENPLKIRCEMEEGTISAQSAARSIQDELLLDSVPALNLGGFATTYMEPEIEELMLKNLVGKKYVKTHDGIPC